MKKYVFIMLFFLAPALEAVTYHNFGVTLSQRLVPFALYARTPQNDKASTAITPGSNPLNNMAEYASGGIVFPLSLDFSYYPLQPLELYTGFTYAPPWQVTVGRDAYLQTLAIRLGYRYYTNLAELVQGFWIQEFELGFPLWNIGGSTGMGLRFKLHDHISLSVWNAVGISAMLQGESTGAQASLLIGLGVQAHF